MDASAEKPEYSHTQKAPLCLLIYALAAVFLAMGWFVRDAPPIPWRFPPIGLPMLVIAASFHHLTVEDLLAAGGGDIREVAVDKGYHSAEVIETFANETRYRLYTPEKTLPDGKKRRWKQLTASRRRALRNHQRRARGDHGRVLQRRRSEIVERTFAHTCEMGGGRRSWLRGVVKVAKRHLLTATAHNLGCLMRKPFGMGTPRGLQGFTVKLRGSHPALKTTPTAFTSQWITLFATRLATTPPASRPTLAAL
jgi:hypothetical protein